MSTNLLTVLLHLGSILTLVKDVKISIADLIAGKISWADAKDLGDDVLCLLKCGLIPIPGLTKDQIDQVILELEKSLGLSTESC